MQMKKINGGERKHNFLSSEIPLAAISETCRTRLSLAGKAAPNSVDPNFD